jgi:transmembrane sensor
MQETEIKALLKKYIDQQCSPEELAFVLNYIQLPEGKQALENLLLDDWNTFESNEPAAGEAGLWYARLNNRTRKQQSFSILRNYNWIKYAAILLLVTGIGAWLTFQQHHNEAASPIVMLEKHNPRGQRSQLVLQDSSVVYLGADSRLRYPEQLNGRTRELYLEGEAFFEVKHDSKRPFIVHTGNARTQVLGTSFKIEAFKGQQLAVAVATGKVSVGYLGQHHQVTSLATLTPGKKLSWDPVSHQSGITTLATDDIKGWKDGNLAFSDARLDEISHTLERWYNVRVIIKGDKPKAYSLSININGKAPITLALDAITGATGLRYRINQDQITISKK